MLNRDDVLKVARLAKLKITHQEADEYQQQLQKVLEHFQKIAQVNTENIEPLITPIPVDLYLREDRVEQTVAVEDILKCAPDAKGNLFKVPPVV